MDGNGIQLSTVDDAILAILNADWQMACIPWRWLADAGVISVKVPPPFENFTIWLAGASACLCSKTCTPHERLWLAAVGPRVGPSVLVGYVIQVENTRSTCLPALKLWNWKSVLSWVWKWSVSVLLMYTENCVPIPNISGNGSRIYQGWWDQSIKPDI